MLLVRDVYELEKGLRKSGSTYAGDAGAFLEECVSWYEESRPYSVIDRQTFAILCEAIRTESEDVRQLACGALAVVRDHSNSWPEKARFVSRFAVNLVSRISNRTRRWSGAFLTANDYNDALELFEVARGDNVYEDSHLIEETKSFIKRHHSSPDLFGRLSQDLATLIEVLEASERPLVDKDTARAALVYFVETSDAIPDDLGPVGYLDDALVVSKALKQIEPDRGALASFLDELIEKWPFLLDLAFEAGGQDYPLSEYALINVALLMGRMDTSDRGTGVALVLPEFGHLPYILGFLITLAQVYSKANFDESPDFQLGDRLVDRESGEEYFFDGYRDSNYAECSKSKATHFAVRQPKQTRGQRSSTSHGDVTDLKPLEHLGALKLSSRETKTLKTGSQRIDLQGTRLGPLENLFGTTHPVSLPAELRTVVVVSKYSEAQGIAQSLKLFGIPCLDILSTGKAKCDEEIELTSWTNKADGGTQTITIVRTTSDALEMVERFTPGVEAVIAPVRPDSTDAANLRRLSADGVPVLALVEERDLDGQVVFEKSRFDFWFWNKDWFQYLHWPNVDSHEDHPIARYENGIQSINDSSFDVIELQSDSVNKAYADLRKLERHATDLEDESIKNTSAEAFLVFLSLIRSLSNDWSDDKLFLKLEEYIRSGKRWWGDELLEAVTTVAESLKAFASELAEHNPKLAALEEWVLDNDNGVVIGPARMKQQLDPGALASNLKWMPSIRRGSDDDALFVPAWLGRRTMERVLVPPARRRISLALYAPEVSWLNSMTKTHRLNQQRLSNLARSRSAIQQVRGSQPEKQSAKVAIEAQDPLIDQILLDYRRARALADSGHDGEDQVDARLVFFNGGPWAAFGPNARIHTFTHILDEDNEDELPERLVADLQPGDRVLMVRGSERSAIAHTADRHLPAGTRELAMLWQTSLRQCFQRMSVREIQKSLAANGCRRTTQTIRGWIQDEHRIGPKEPVAETLTSIALVTRDADFKDRIEECAQAIRLVRSAHITAGHELQDTLITRVREWLESEVSPDELVEVEEQVVLLAVEFVDPEPATVSRKNLNRLREGP